MILTYWILFRDIAESDSENDYNQESEKEEVESGIRPSMSKEHKDMMGQICVIFSDKFVIVGQVAIPAAQNKVCFKYYYPII